MEKLLLIDGSSLLHRAFYALPLLTNKDGLFTNAVHGFMMMLNKMLGRQQPDYVLVGFDKSRVTFRTAIDPAYKGNRSATPVELRGQFELIKEVLSAASIRWYEQDDYEADDIIGTMSARGSADGLAVEIFSGDRDVFQLIDEHTTVYMTKKGITEIECYDTEAIRERYGVTPRQLIEVKGLQGDTSDNIPGVPGVGEKTALKLINQYHDIDGLYAHVDEIKGKLGEKLAANKEQAYRSRELATICRDMPIGLTWDACAYDAAADKTELAAVYRRLELNQLLRGLGQAQKPAASARRTVIVTDDEERPWTTEDESLPQTGDIFADDEAVKALAEKIKAAASCGLLCCWEGPVVKGRITKLGIALAEDESVCVSREKLPLLGGILADPAVAKHTYNCKEAYILLRANGIELAGVADDAVLAAYLLDPARSDLELADIAAGEEMLAFPTAAGAQAALLPRLCERLRQKLTDDGMLALYTDMELPLAAVLADMEFAGVRVEGSKLVEMSAVLSRAEQEYQQKIYAIAGHEFNINSPKQLGTVLFEELGIPPVKKTKTGYSTNAEVLESLAPAWEIAGLVLDYRMVAKLRSTYTDGLRELIDPDTGKIHTSYKQTVTATGRLSSVEPNLQNIPVRHELGRQIRKVFTADGEGDILVAADYNQIELRVLAHIANDEKLIDAFRKGEDIHTRTASEVLGVAKDEITPEQRRQAKAVNFGIVYGISDYGLAKDLHISRAEAADYIARYFQRYPGVAAYQQKTIMDARVCGYVSTLCGRRRYLPDLLNRSFNLRSLAERMAINAPVQGSAADIIKLAMVRIAAELKKRGLHSQMLLQVHDELIFNVPREEKDELVALIKDKMEHVMELAVPLTVDIKAGADWYDMEKLK